MISLATRQGRSSAPRVADRSEPWWTRAACLGHDPALWSRTTYTHELVDAYGNPWGRTERRGYHSSGCTLCVAVPMCRKGCTVRRECLDDAMTWETGQVQSTRDGIYGGLTPRQRWRLARRTETEEKTA